MAAAMLDSPHFPPKKRQMLAGPFSAEASWGFRISRSLLELTHRAASIWAPIVEPQYKLVKKYVSPTPVEREAPHAPRKPSPLRKAWKLVKVT